MIVSFRQQRSGYVGRQEKLKVWRDSRPARIIQELEDSLRRLHRAGIDIYQVHWPDHRHPLEDTMETLCQLRSQGKIRCIGLSHFDVPQINAASRLILCIPFTPPIPCSSKGSSRSLGDNPGVVRGGQFLTTVFFLFPLSSCITPSQDNRSQ